VAWLDLPGLLDHYGSRWTMTFEEVRTEIPKSFLDKGIFGIGAFWHGRLLMMPGLLQREEAELSRLVHRDGQIIGSLGTVRFLMRFSVRQAERYCAFKQMLRAIQGGSDIAITRMDQGPATGSDRRDRTGQTDRKAVCLLLQRFQKKAVQDLGSVSPS